ncbi:MAG: hypothetical protein ACK559_41895, partial [bacterium]
LQHRPVHGLGRQRRGLGRPLAAHHPLARHPRRRRQRLVQHPGAVRLKLVLHPRARLGDARPHQRPLHQRLLLVLRRGRRRLAGRRVRGQRLRRRPLDGEPAGE